MNIISKILAIIMITYSIGITQAPELVEGWPYVTSRGIYTARQTPRFVMESDINNSGIYIGSGGIFEVLKFHFDGSFYPSWPQYFPNNTFNDSPILCDIDHDGRMESIYTASAESLFIFNSDGTINPGYPMYFDGIVPPNIADFDDDGVYELIFITYGTDLIYCIDIYGAIEPGWPIPRPQWASGSVGGAGAVGDIDLDGKLEYILKGQQDIYCFRFDGTTQPGFPIHIFDDDWFYQAWFGPSLADIDSDGHLEIIITGNDNISGNRSGFVTIYEHTGEVKTGWPRFIYDRFPAQCPTVGDINNDGILELGFSASSMIHFMDSDAFDLPGWPVAPPNQSSSVSDLILVDVDGDGDCEIFWDNNVLHGRYNGTDSMEYYGYIFGSDHIGQPLVGFPLEIAGFASNHAPTFAYDSSSHQVYMGVYSFITDYNPDRIDSAFVELFRFPDSTGPLTEWPMQSHDNLQTKNYNFVDMLQVGIDNGDEIMPSNFILKQNYPNPFNAHTQIEFALPRSGNVTITIYDILGRKIVTPVNKIMPAGNHAVNIDMTDQSSGLYFYILKSDDTEIKRKMVLLK